MPSPKPATASPPRSSTSPRASASRSRRSISSAATAPTAPCVRAWHRHGGTRHLGRRGRALFPRTDWRRGSGRGRGSCIGSSRRDAAASSTRSTAATNGFSTATRSRRSGVARRSGRPHSPCRRRRYRYRLAVRAEMAAAAARRRSLWHRALFLAGDACHLFVPTGGFGMNPASAMRSIWRGSSPRGWMAGLARSCSPAMRASGGRSGFSTRARPPTTTTRAARSSPCRQTSRPTAPAAMRLAHRSPPSCRRRSSTSRRSGVHLGYRYVEFADCRSRRHRTAADGKRQLRADDAAGASRAACLAEAPAK